MFLLHLDFSHFKCIHVHIKYHGSGPGIFFFFYIILPSFYPIFLKLYMYAILLRFHSFCSWHNIVHRIYHLKNNTVSLKKIVVTQYIHINMLTTHCPTFNLHKRKLYSHLPILMTDSISINTLNNVIGRIIQVNWLQQLMLSK